MTETHGDNFLWSIVTLDKGFYAIRLEDIQTMVALPHVTAMPMAPSFVRGVINLRGSVVPVVDLRKRLGMASLITETADLISMLNKREEDHKNWMMELESSIKEKRGFTLETDPCRCAFGKWYDNFKTDKLLLDSLLKKFDEPHRKIHAIAHTVLLLQKEGRHDEAIKAINDTRKGALSEMFQLFASLRTTLNESLREIAIVIQSKQKPFAVIVDSVETVGHLAKGSIEAIKSSGISSNENGLVKSFGKLEKTDKLVLILDLSKIFSNEDNAEPAMEDRTERSAM